MVNFMNSVAAWRLTFTVLLLSLGGLTAIALPLPQEGDDEVRRLWNKQFQDARAKAKNTASATGVRPAKQGAPSASNRPRPQTTGSAPTASSSATLNERLEASPSALEAVTADELIGLTIWRLRPAAAKDARELPRLLVQKQDDKPGEKTGELLAERINAETPIREGELVRLGIEVPREGASYIYVIDREVYADGSMSDPYLIFPAKTTPRSDEVGGAGKITYVPSRN